MKSRARLVDEICGWAEISDLIQRSQPTLGFLLLIHLQVGELQYDLSSCGNLLDQFVAVECPKESEEIYIYIYIMYINTLLYIYNVSYIIILIYVFIEIQSVSKYPQGEFLNNISSHGN